MSADEFAAEVVDRLRSARSVSWLRVSTLRAIDAAEFDAPPEEATDADVVAAPYGWLFGRVGDGVKLTQACAIMSSYQPTTPDSNPASVATLTADRAHP